MGRLCIACDLQNGKNVCSEEALHHVRIFALKSEALVGRGNNFGDFPENQIIELHGEFSNFINAEFGNAKILNHRKCASVGLRTLSE